MTPVPLGFNKHIRRRSVFAGGEREYAGHTLKRSYAGRVGSPWTQVLVEGRSAVEHGFHVGG